MAVKTDAMSKSLYGRLLLDCKFYRNERPLLLTVSIKEQSSLVRSLCEYLHPVDCGLEHGSENHKIRLRPRQLGINCVLSNKKFKHGFGHSRVQMYRALSSKAVTASDNLFNIHSMASFCVDCESADTLPLPLE